MAKTNKNRLGIILASFRSRDTGKAGTVDVSRAMSVIFEPLPPRWFDPILEKLILSRLPIHCTCMYCGRRIWSPIRMKCIKPKCWLERRRGQKELRALFGDDDSLEFQDLMDYGGTMDVELVDPELEDEG